MADTTTVLGLPFPEGADANDVPADMQMTVSAAGSGNYRIPLPVTPRSTAVSARRIGMLQLDSSGYLKHMLVEQANGATYCNAVELTAGDLFEYLTGTMVANWISTYGSPANITWDFQYEAA